MYPGFGYGQPGFPGAPPPGFPGQPGHGTLPCRRTRTIKDNYQLSCNFTMFKWLFGMLSERTSSSFCESVTWTLPTHSWPLFWPNLSPNQVIKCCRYFKADIVVRIWRRAHG